MKEYHIILDPRYRQFKHDADTSLQKGTAISMRSLPCGVPFFLDDQPHCLVFFGFAFVTQRPVGVGDGYAHTVSHTFNTI